MTTPKLPLNIALAAAVELPGGADAPEWIHLVPTAQGEVNTFDTRGPYRVEDAAAIVAASMADPRGLPIDENHSLYIAAPQGQSAPARGWITGMEVRPDGIWGRVEWTAAGRELVASRAYRAISPVIRHDKAGRIHSLTCASLVNRPNFQGLTALNQEITMTFQTTLAEKLGLAADASEEDILAALPATGTDTALTSLQSAMGEIGVALGVEAGAKPEAILAAAKASKPKGAGDITALQSELTALQAENVELAKRVNVLTEGSARAAAVSFVDGEIRKGRVGLKPRRDTYIAMHMEDAAKTEELVTGLPILGASGALTAPPAAGKDGEISLNAEQVTAAKMLGLDPKQYAATLKDERAGQEGF
ncbi:phage protease [Acidimangrovimonas sediminis]|uniref:phage protease n=1 Tax=Acidimangrovimonas sediminis TaxID=2056283 RepID=UPI000C809F82|nr:phage protease [Acidimangrovimonas sediminis]